MELNTSIKIIAVDFDSTLTLNEDTYPECGTPNEPAIALLKKYRENGGKLILWTCRYGKSLFNALKLCSDYGLYFDAVNDNLPEQSALWRESHPNAEMSRKIFAHLYIDDKDPRSVLMGGVDWNTISMLLFQKPLNEVVVLS